jgi:malonate decarboxylase beta subunit
MNSCGGLSSHAAPIVSLHPLPPRERIEAIADPGSVAAVDVALAAPRPSPHLARWGIDAQDDDGVVVARAKIRGAPVFIAAQDERFLGGSTGARHADALRALFERARSERPAAVILLAASGGVRLHEANPAELALARALRALLDLRVAGVRVLALGVADVFGGTSVLACAADRIALLPGAKLGLSGPKVIEMAHGRGELDPGDTRAIAALFGGQARAAAGQVELVTDRTEAMRDWIALDAAEKAPFADSVRALQARLGERLVAYRYGHAVVAAKPIAEALGTPITPLPRMLSSLYAGARPVDREGWLWRIPERRVWLTRPFGLGTFGPREAHALDAALLAHLADGGEREPAILFVVGDSGGHEATRAAEALCVAQYLAQLAAVLALLRSQGVRMIGLLTDTGHSAAFFASALQATRVYALAGARVVAMEPAAIARVTRLDAARLAALIEDDPLLGQPVRHFAAWGGVAGILPDAGRDRLFALMDAEGGA